MDNEKYSEVDDLIDAIDSYIEAFIEFKEAQKEKGKPVERKAKEIGLQAQLIRLVVQEREKRIAEADEAKKKARTLLRDKLSSVID